MVSPPSVSLMSDIINDSVNLVSENSKTVVLSSAASVQDEPVSKESYDKYVIEPKRVNQDIWSMYKKQVQSFWTVEEVDLLTDINDWKHHLSDNDKYFIKMILAFFAGADGIVNENLTLRFYGDIDLPEVRLFYGFQNAMEGIHQEMYSTMIDTFITNESEKSELFHAIDNFPCIQKKALWAKKWISDTSPYAHRLVAFACVEGLFFSGSFAAIFWIKKRGMMPGLTFSNELISRDESLHTDFAVLMYNKIVSPENRLPKELFAELIREAVAIETEFIIDALPCRLIGMNSGMMTQYIEFVADRLCVQLGYDKCFNSASPFTFMELQSVEGKANFFERTVSSYALATKDSGDNLFAKEDEVVDF